MTRHLMSRESRREGESMADQFRRIAREKPNPKEGEGCRICGADHRCPQEYWPAEELAAHNAAAAGSSTPDTSSNIYGVDVADEFYNPKEAPLNGGAPYADDGVA